jgi:hypothetical protein
MKKPELTDMGWLGPRDEMDRSSLYEAFRTHVKVKHSEDST